MLDENMKLEDYFEEEIKRVSDIEINQIDQDIDEIRQRALADMENDAKREATIEQETIEKEMMSDHAIALSKTHETSNRKLMVKRQELSDQVFHEVLARLQTFAKSSGYQAYLVDKAKELASHDYGHVVFYVGKQDEEKLSDIRKAYGDCEGFVDERITIGGYRMECLEKGIVVDETFDTGIQEQKEWFYTNSGLFIK